MTKRNPGLPRNLDNFYPTPKEAIKMLLPHLRFEGITFAEPCAGDGDIVNELEAEGFRCGYEGDIRWGKDALLYKPDASISFNCTNPPWDRSRAIMHRIMDHLIETGLPTWLLLPMDWLANQYSTPRHKYLSDIVMLGRVKWVPGSKYGGYDNSMWARFHKFHTGGLTLHGQPPKKVTS
jgi:hypothetical protein